MFDVASAVHARELEEVGNEDEVVHLVIGVEAFTLLGDVILDCLHQATEAVLHEVDSEDAQFVLQGSFLLRIVLQVQLLDEYGSMFEWDGLQDGFVSLTGIVVDLRGLEGL